MKNNNLKRLVYLIGLSGTLTLMSPISSAEVPIMHSCTAASSAMVSIIEEYGGKNSPAAGTCTKSKNVYEFTGDAESQLEQFGTEIGEAGEAIAEAISSNAANEIEIITEGNKSLMFSMVDITNSQIKDQLKQDKMMLDMKMDYLTELQERELKASQGIMGMDDSREEAMFIIHELNTIGGGSEGAYNHSHEVIASMKKNYDDDPSFMMPIRIKSAESPSSEGAGCAEYDPAAHKSGSLDMSCFYGVKSSPGGKLEKYFKECSRLKAQSIASVKRSMAKTVSSASQKKSMSSYMSKSKTQKPEELLQKKQMVQRETSCSVKEFGYKLCGNDKDGNRLSAEDYLKNVMNLKIVPYGNVSSSNFLSPVAVGSTDGDIGDISEDEMQAMATRSLTYKTNDSSETGSEHAYLSDPSASAPQPAIAASSNTPKVVKTYRTSAQYFAAVDFVDNIINKEAVSGMNVTRSTNASNAMFQSKFMSRAASLSLAENSLRNAIEIRTGSSISGKVQEATKEGDAFDRDSSLVREDINGAGALDTIIHLVDKDYNRLQSDAKSVIAGGGSREIETAPNKVSDWQVEALIKSNQLALMQFEQNERIELLLAALLANTTNSEHNISYINSLKLK